MGQRKITFDVPAGGGDYAPEVIICRPDNEAGQPDQVLELQINVASLPAAAEIEVDKLDIAGNPDDDDDWSLHETLTATGVQDIIAFSGWPGVRVRAKSGATAGDAEVHASWLSTGD